MPTIGTCKLCLQEAELQKSHLIPAAAYAHLTPHPTAQPVLSTYNPKTQRHSMLQTSQQIQQHLLCSDCEHLLARRGESWILQRLAVDGISPLYDAISQRTPHIIEYEPDELRVYNSAGMPEFDQDKIIHFALGVFFKAGAAEWRIGKESKGISLGPYLDSIRKFVLGNGDFPERCALVFSITPPQFVTKLLCSPYEWAGRECHTFSFYMIGLEFVLAVGKRIPNWIKQNCYVRAAGNPVLTHSISSQLITSKSLEIRNSGRVFGKLRDSWGLPRT